MRKGGFTLSHTTVSQGSERAHSPRALGYPRSPGQTVYITALGSWVGASVSVSSPGWAGRSKASVQSHCTYAPGLLGAPWSPSHTRNQTWVHGEPSWRWRLTADSGRTNRARVTQGGVGPCGGKRSVRDEGKGVGVVGSSDASLLHFPPCELCRVPHLLCEARPWAAPDEGSQIALVWLYILHRQLSA